MAQAPSAHQLVSGTPAQPRAWRWCRLLLALPLLFYIAFPTRNYYWDGIAFALEIEKRKSLAALLSPSHLLYMLWGDWLYRLSDLLGIHTRALFVMQTANSLLAGLCVLLLYVALRQAGASAPACTIAALAFGFSATWWRFATDANAYIPAICLLLAAYLLLNNPRWIILAGFAHAGAMLFHELAIFFLLVALLKLGKNRRAAAIYLAASLAPVAVIYWLAYKASAPAGGFLPWITTHSPDSGFWFHIFDDLALTIRGTLRLFFGGKLSDLPSGPLFKLALVVFLSTAIAFFVSLWRALRRVKVRFPPLLLIAWAGVYLAFLFFWMPQNTFYRLFYLAPLIAMAALAIHSAKDTRLPGWLLVTALFLWNFTFVIYPQSRIESNAALSFALAQHDHWPPGTPIAFHRFHPDLWTISYFNPQAVWIGLDRCDIAELDRNLEYARKQHEPLWLEATAFDLISADAEGRRWLAEHEKPNELILFRDPKHEFRFEAAR